MRKVLAVVSDEAWEALDAAAATKGCTVEELAKGVLETASVRLRATEAPFGPAAGHGGPRAAVAPDGRIGPWRN